MLGYFRLPSTIISDEASFHGMKPFMQAIEAFATAAAGSTPTNPDPTNITEFEVLGNREAGGWTKKFDLFGGDITNGDQFEFEANTLKTGTTDYALTKKVFGFNVGNYDVVDNTSYWGVIKPYMKFVREDADGNRIQDDREWLSPYTSYTSSTQYHAWPSERSEDMFDHGFLLSVTENYLILRRGHPTNSFGGSVIVGVVDTTAGHPNDYAPYSPHMPFVGFDHLMASAFTEENIEFRIHYQTDQASRASRSGNASQYLQDQSQWNTNINGVGNVNRAYIPMNWDPHVLPFGPCYGQDASENMNNYEVRSATFDDQMRIVPALHDIYMYNPFLGSPMRILHGIKDVGLINYAEWDTGERDDYEPGYMGEIITDQNGDNWIIFEALNDIEHYQAIRAD